MVDLSVIIVNYKTPQLVIDCIESIYAQTKEHSFEIIVIDNDSRDGSKEQILSKFANVQWLDMGYNSGFARANNAGIKVANGRYILLLNGDTIVLDGALDKCIHLMDQNPQVAACGVQLLNADGTTQISGAHNKKGGLNVLLTIPYIGNMVRYWGYRLKSKVPSIQNISDEKTEVDWIIGAFIMARKTAIDKSGLLDEDFFMYAEEMEWCSRLKKQGQLCLFFQNQRLYTLAADPASQLLKLMAGTTPTMCGAAKARQIMLSHLVRVRKEFGAGWFLVIQFFYILGVPVFFGGWLIEKNFRSKPRYLWKHVAGYSNNVLSVLKYFFRILMNQPFFYKV